MYGNQLNVEKRRSVVVQCDNLSQLLVYIISSH